MKAGRREQGLKAAASHTASMTGRYEIYQAAMEQSGIIEVRSIDELASLVRGVGVHVHSEQFARSNAGARFALV